MPLRSRFPGCRCDAVAAALLSLLLLPAAPCSSQTAEQYEQRYGPVVTVSLNDLAQDPAGYEDRAVRTRGRLTLDSDATRRGYALQDSFASGVAIQAVGDAAAPFDSDVMRMIGSQLEITGVVRRLSTVSAMSGRPQVAIQFWRYLGPPEREPKGEIASLAISLEHLVQNPGQRDGQTLRVVGKFRGRNLYGDLPARSERVQDDWVIKDDVYAIWVTGRKPKGDGFDLDLSLKRDTGKWLEVVGRPETRNGITYLRALRVTLSAPPTPSAQAQPPSPPPARPKHAPVVVFTLPLDGDPEVAKDTRFVIQFSKDMDEETFTGRVRFGYAGPRRPGDPDFTGVRLKYDRGLRALTVDPADALGSGRAVEIALLPGILDIEGLALEPRPGKHPDQAVDVLRYQVAF